MSERDIIERLRKLNKPALLPSLQGALADAADEIERLQSYEEANIEGGEIIIELKQEIERLREALKAYLFAEQIDDEMERQSELSVARQDAEALLNPRSTQ